MLEARDKKQEIRAKKQEIRIKACPEEFRGIKTGKMVVEVYYLVLEARTEIREP